MLFLVRESQILVNTKRLDFHSIEHLFSLWSRARLGLYATN
jgi:hypothetical protein